MIQCKTDYNKWAKYYDVIYKIMEPEDSKIYNRHLKDVNSVLEMGIGTGRILLDYIKCGIQWTGIDNSDEMIKICKEKFEPMQPLNEKIYLIKEDMTKLEIKEEKNSVFNRKFDLVIYPSHSIMSVGNEEKQIEALCSGFKHLSKEGVLIFDLHNPNNYFVSSEYNLLKSKTIKNEKYKLYSKSKVDIEKKLHSNYQILEMNKEKINLESYEYFLYLEDVLRISDELDFEIIDFFGNYNMEPYNEYSEEMIFICKKRYG